MKTVKVYEDNEGDYALEYNGKFYGFSSTPRVEAARYLVQGKAFVEYDEEDMQDLGLKLVDKYEFED